MFVDKLQNVNFKYSDKNVAAVLDRLPTAKFLAEANYRYIVVAEVFIKGIDMWLRSQGGS